jgi:hypothetical protein
LNYRVYGLVLDADEPVPELAAVAVSCGEDEADIRFTRAAPSAARPDPEVWFMHWHLPSGEPWLSAARAEAGYVLRFHDLADFVVDRDGCEISCIDATDGVTPETTRHLLIDHVMPLLLNLRGDDALHASAVLTDSGAILFTGPSGIGKSTVAAELARAGLTILADDCVVVREGVRGFEVRPAYPGLRLCADAAGRLDLCGEQLPVAGYTDKRRIAVDFPMNGAANELHPLRAVYVLDEGPVEEVATASLSPRDAAMALVARAFRFEVDDRAMLERQLDLFTRVAAQVPVRRLFLPDGLDRVAEIRSVVPGCVPA